MKFIVKDTIITIHGDSGMPQTLESNVPFFEMKHGSQDMMISGFKYDKIKCITMAPPAREYYPMDFYPYSNVCVLEMMRKHGLLPWNGLGP